MSASGRYSRVQDALQRFSVAAQSRDPRGCVFVAIWAPALQRTAERRCAASGARDRLCRHTFASSRRTSPEFCFRLAPSGNRGRREDRVPAWHPRSAVRELREEQLHSGIQVRPNIRPSLRSGFTAYVALSPGSVALLPPSPCDCSQDLTPACGRQDHTILPYARPRPVVHETMPVRRSPRPPPLTPRFVTIAIRPSEGMRWRTDTTIPNFGKAECFGGYGLTHAWVFLPTAIQAMVS